MGNKELVYHIVRQLSEDSRLWNFMLKKKRKERENVNGKKELSNVKENFSFRFLYT